MSDQDAFDQDGFDKDGWHRIHQAALEGNIDLVRAQLDAGTDVDLVTRNEFRSTPLIAAAWRGHYDVAKLLMERKASVASHTKSGGTPLSLACTGDHLRIAALLLDHKACVNTQNNTAWTPLAFAAFCGYFRIVTLLLEHKACVDIIATDPDDAPDHSNGTALDKAVQARRFEVLDVLQRAQKFDQSPL